MDPLPPPSPIYKTPPFLPLVKNILTTKTCNAAVPTITTFSTTLNLKILCSVLLTVLKLRFSLVLKYF